MTWAVGIVAQQAMTLYPTTGKIGAWVAAQLEMSQATLFPYVPMLTQG